MNIGENNESQYLRNQNFSSTIVLELEQTDTKEKQCVGVVFDVETATNEINRLFFWHKSGLLENQYRADKRCLTTFEVKEYLQRTFQRKSIIVVRAMRDSADRCMTFIWRLDIENFLVCSSEHSVPYEYQTGRFRERIYLYGTGYAH